MLLLLLLFCVDFCGVVCRDDRRVGVAIIYALFSLSLSENALVVEKLVFVLSVYLPRIKYAQATTTTLHHQTNETRPTEERECVSSFLNFLFLKPKFFASLSRRFFFSRQTKLLSFSLLHIKIFPFAFVTLLPCFAKTTFFDSHFSRLVHFSLKRLVK